GFDTNFLRATDYPDDAPLGCIANVRPRVGRSQDRSAQDVRHGTGEGSAYGAGSFNGVHKGSAHRADGRVNDLARPSNALDDPGLHSLHDALLLRHWWVPPLIQDRDLDRAYRTIQLSGPHPRIKQV